MKFGKVDDASLIDFTLPEDHFDNLKILENSKNNEPAKFHIGCAKWNKTDFKNFYLRGTKNELEYYANEFNSIELNATFYRLFGPEQFTKWKDATPDNFRFFPKVTKSISQFKRLKDAEEIVDSYTNAVRHLDHKLGGVFLQMMHNFAPKDFERVVNFVEYWPKDIPLSVEFRHTDWYNDNTVAKKLYHLFESNNIQNVITDTAGRRDLLLMRLTYPNVFIRYVGASHKSDYTRLDDWIVRIKQWIDQGAKEINFFIHQNKELGLDLHVPKNLLDIEKDGLKLF